MPSTPSASCTSTSFSWFKSAWLWPLAAGLALTLGGMLAATLAAFPQNEPIKPAAPAAPGVKPGGAVVVTINLETVFNGITEKQQADAKLNALLAELQAQLKTQKAALEQLEADIKDHAEGTDKFQAATEKWAMAALEFRAAEEFAQRKLEVERALTLKRIYLSIKQSVKAMAQASGYDMVLVDDSITEIPPGNEEEITRQISARRMLYVNPNLDVTQELITRMNAAFGLGAANGAGGAATQPSTRPARSAQPAPPTTKPAAPR